MVADLDEPVVGVADEVRVDPAVGVLPEKLVEEVAVGGDVAVRDGEDCSPHFSPLDFPLASR